MASFGDQESRPAQEALDEHESHMDDEARSLSTAVIDVSTEMCEITMVQWETITEAFHAGLSCSTNHAEGAVCPEQPGPRSGASGATVCALGSH